MSKPNLPKQSEIFYREILRIRRVEEEIARIYPSDKITSPIHLSIGQEAISAAVCQALRKEDVVFGTHRSHAMYLAKGGNLNRMMAELFGKASGCCKGRGGSMHLIDVSAGVMGTSAIVGTTISHAVGYAYALKLRKELRVVVCFFGDGAVEEGAFHESMNFAALKKVPVLFVCENNQYSVHAKLQDRHSKINFVEKAEAYGIPAFQLDGCDPRAVYEKAEAAVSDMRGTHHGPVFLECSAYRWKEHVGPGEDYHCGYRSIEEKKAWEQRDALLRLIPQVPENIRNQIEAEIQREIHAAVEFAENSPWPPAEYLEQDLWAEDPAQTHASLQEIASARTLSYSQALQEAAAQEMRRDASVFVFGIGADDFKGTYGTTAHLLDEFGKERVFDTPASEDAMTGFAIGASLGGLRPIHVHIRMDFLTLAMNQLVNIASKARSMYGGAVSIPLVVRAMIGRSWGQGAQHSQGLHALLMHIPGIRVIAPSTPYDAKGCLIHAIRDPNPVLLVDHRLLHFQKGPVPENAYTVPWRKARVLREGKDITLVGISWMAVECMRAAEMLSGAGVSAEVIDPISLSPLDMDTIVQSAEKTGRLIVVDTAWTFCGASAEILAQAAERLQDKPVQLKRLGYQPVNCPTAPNLEALFYPDAQKIVDAVCGMMRRDPLKTVQPRKDSEAVAF